MLAQDTPTCAVKTARVRHPDAGTKSVGFAFGGGNLGGLAIEFVSFKESDWRNLEQLADRSE